MDNLLNYLIAVAIIVVIPGPNIILIMNNSMKHGFKSGILTILGIKAGMFLLLMISLSGISTILIYFSSVFTVIKWLGVLYLIYLGISQIAQSFRKPKKTSEIIFDRKYFVKGFVISVTNPKGLVFAGAFFPQFIDPKGPLITQSIVLCGGLILISIVIELFYAYFSSMLSNILKTERMQKILDRVSGLVFIVFGVGLSLYKRSS